jgi:X-Pro dipeptidyl-peptidase
MTPGSTKGVGALGSAAPPAKSTASFTDNPKQDDDQWAADPTSTAADRLVYSTGPLAKATTVSGTTSITLTVTPSAAAARLSAVLVDYGSTTMRHYDNPNGDEGILTLDTQSCFGDSTQLDSSCYYDTAPDTETVDTDVFDRGWADLGHYQSLTSQQALTPGTPYTITFTLNTTDHTVPAGHTLALVIGGTDNGYIEPATGKPTLKVNLSKSSVTLPLSIG